MGGRPWNNIKCVVLVPQKGIVKELPSLRGV